VDYDYSKRGYLLPDGCKDLFDVIQPKKNFFFVTIPLPGLTSADLEIFAEGNMLRIIVKQSAKKVQYERKIQVPGGFEIEKARAVCLEDVLHITVPKATEHFPPSLQDGING
jgi:HSP20 family molecular chaperone IbpA